MRHPIVAWLVRLRWTLREQAYGLRNIMEGYKLPHAAALAQLQAEKAEFEIVCKRMGM